MTVLYGQKRHNVSLEAKGMLLLFFSFFLSFFVVRFSSPILFLRTLKCEDDETHTHTHTLYLCRAQRQSISHPDCLHHFHFVGFFIFFFVFFFFLFKSMNVNANTNGNAMVAFVLPCCRVAVLPCCHCSDARSFSNRIFSRLRTLQLSKRKNEIFRRAYSRPIICVHHDFNCLPLIQIIFRIAT